MLNGLGEASLSDREIEVLKALEAGHKDSAIAQLLGISQRTVLHHITQARKKLKCNSRAQLVAVAIRSGII